MRNPDAELGRGEWSSVVDPDPDPELFAGSGVGSGINHFGSGQSGSGMNLIPNFSVKKSHFLNQIAQKIGIFSTYINVHIKYVYIYM
jgi:hypothetical protein